MALFEHEPSAKPRQAPDALVGPQGHERPAVRVIQLDSDLGGAQHLGERGALDFLFPAIGHRCFGVQAAKVGAHLTARLRLKDLRPQRARATGALLHRLDACHFRPPPRKVVGIRDDVPDVRPRRGDRAAAGCFHRLVSRWGTRSDASENRARQGRREPQYWPVLGRLRTRPREGLQPQMAHSLIANRVTASCAGL